MLIYVKNRIETTNLIFIIFDASQISNLPCIGVSLLTQRTRNRGCFAPSVAFRQIGRSNPPNQEVKGLTKKVKAFDFFVKGTSPETCYGR